MKQIITRKDLKSLYDSGICDSWKKVIEKLLSSQQFEEKITVEEELIKKAYSEASPFQKERLLKYFVIPKSITEEIKSFGDILNKAGLNMEEIVPYPNPQSIIQKRLNATAKLALIEKVLNGDWKPDWNGNEYEYFPYFTFRAHCGWDFCYSGGMISLSRVEPAYFKTSELASFAGTVFSDIYKDLFER